MISKKNEVVLIIFNLKKRTNFINRYFKLLEKFHLNYSLFDILIINERGIKFPQIKNLAKLQMELLYQMNIL